MRPAKRNSSLYFNYPEYAFTRPVEMEGVQTKHSVVIIGGGPVGVTAALELARHGIASVVLDEKNTVNDGSRAICVARHSMEILQQLDLSDKFESKALPWTHGTSYYKDQPVYRLEMPHSDQERFHPMYNIQQQYIEQYLIDKALKEPLIEIRWLSKVIDFEQNINCCVVTVETPQGQYKFHAAYTLAADGGRSAVRRLSELKLNGDSYEGRYVIADIQMQSDYPTERRAFFDPSSNPGLTILVHKQPENIWRIDYQVDGDIDEKQELQEERIRSRIASILDMMGETGSWELEWWSLYKAYTLALDDYRHKRVLFVGDSAHLVPIFGVRGLNSGLADAVNAAWKLAYVIHGWSNDSLLDSYSPERRGATLDVFRNASKSTKFMTPPSRGYQLVRDAALSLALNNDFTQHLINPRQSQPYTYSESCLSSFSERDAEFESGPQTGAALINQRFTENDYLLDNLGKGFSGLYFTDSESIDEGLLQCFSELNVGNEEFTLIIISRDTVQSGAKTISQDNGHVVFETYNAQPGTFYLIRPDRHICARWRSIQTNEVIQAFRQSLGETL